MFNRRSFIAQVALAATGCAFAEPAALAHARRSPRPARTMLYASEGKTLYSYALNQDTGELHKAGMAQAPETVQFAVLHPGRHLLCVVCSNGGPGGRAGDTHFLTTMQVDPENGALGAQRAVLSLPQRPIHVAIDPIGRFVVVAFNKPADVQVYGLTYDGGLTGPVPQKAVPDVGIFPHQTAFDQSGNTLWVCARGNDGAPGKVADPGCLTAFNFAGGVLTKAGRVGFPEGVGPREMALHPQKAWAFVALERGNSLAVYQLKGGTLADTPSYVKDTRQDQHMLRPRQRTGTVHVHPNGRFVYIVNRADKTARVDGQDVWIGGENNIAVFAINPENGEPILIQHVSSGGIEPRSFVIDPSGRHLVVGNQSAMLVRRDDKVVEVPAGLVVFYIGADGMLTQVSTRQAESKEELIWTGIARFG